MTEAQSGYARSSIPEHFQDVSKRVMRRPPTFLRPHEAARAAGRPRALREQARGGRRRRPQAPAMPRVELGVRHLHDPQGPVVERALHRICLVSVWVPGPEEGRHPLQEDRRGSGVVDARRERQAVLSGDVRNPDVGEVCDLQVGLFDLLPRRQAWRQRRDERIAVQRLVERARVELADVARAGRGRRGGAGFPLRREAPGLLDTVGLSALRASGLRSPLRPAHASPGRRCSCARLVRLLAAERPAPASGGRHRAPPR
jgi:hypothetical protein